MRLYIESLKLHIKSSLEYKASFLLEFFSQIFYLFTNYFIILALFTKFDNIRGFTVYEVLLTFAIIEFGFSINEGLSRGIDAFDDFIVDGSFDRLLLRPQPIILQVLCSKIALVKLSRTVQTIIIMVISLVNLNIDWNIAKVITLMFMLLSSIAIFFGLFLLMAAYCFHTVKGLEIRNLVTDGGKHISQYPIGIFKKGVVFIFSYIVPYAFVNYYPLLYLLGKSDNKWYIFSPLIVILYLFIPFLLFKRGMKKYTSAGS